ncbi:zf-HC2 domain-containing protein, partial [Streptomyces zaomyceticus]|uniref:zf-HC2 domain-containing protein n=1 Tax=Streptomyces zaomyceticus TaxID=68286 RepID=UPI003687B095
MNRQRHEEEVLLGPYVLGVLDDADARRVEAHTAGCEPCREEVDALREMEAALGEVPPEAFVDGPPEGGDLLLQRTLRQMRAERAGVRRGPPRRGGGGGGGRGAARGVVGGPPRP